MRALLLACLFSISILTESNEVNLKHLKCLVCKATMKELEDEISKIGSNKFIEIGSYKMDAKGNSIHKKVPLSRSEVHISDVLDNICEKMTDYVRATKKSNNRLTLFKLISSDSMNSGFDKVNIIQDGDLNKSLQHYCTGIVEEYEDDIVSLYVNNRRNKKEKLCVDISNICNQDYDDFDNDNDDGDGDDDDNDDDDDDDDDSDDNNKEQNSDNYSNNQEDQLHDKNEF